MGATGTFHKELLTRKPHSTSCVKDGNMRETFQYEDWLDVSPRGNVQIPIYGRTLAGNV